MSRPPTLLIALALVALALDDARAQEASSPSTAPAQAAVPIIVDAPGSLDALWERVRSPDFVLLRGDRYRELIKSGEKGTARTEPVVEGVALRGRIDGRAAGLEADFRVASTGAGASWVPIRLDGFVLSSAVEGDKVVPIRAGAGGGWEAGVSGVGTHSLKVAFAARVAANGEERRIDVSIPLAGATSLALAMAEDPGEISLGPGESIPTARSAHGGGRIDAVLRPRSRIELRWQETTRPAEDLPPLLGTQGDIAIDVAAEAIRTRTRWSIAALRGAVTNFEVVVDRSEELIEVDLDGRTISFDESSAAEKGRVAISLPEPLRPGGPARSLTLVTRRKLAGGGGKVAVRGSAIVGASLQGGALAVTQSGPIWVEAESARGLRRIDPANELPSALRSRPGTVLAYRIVDQPFELDLRVEPAPPRLDVRAEAMVVLKPGSATTDLRMTFRATPGRVFEVAFPVVEGEEVEPPAPDPVVELTRWREPTGPDAGGRALVVLLTSRARESGAFTIALRVRRPLPAGTGRWECRLPWPSGASSLGGRVAFVRAPGVEATPAVPVRPGEDRPLARIDTPRQEDWPWPLDRYADLDPAPIWASFEGLPRRVALDIAERKESYRAHVDIEARVGRSGIVYRSGVRLDVVGGLLDDFELVVPPDVDRDWTIAGLDVAARYPVRTEPDGANIYRIALARKGGRSVAFELRYATLFGRPLDPDSPREGRFAWIRPSVVAHGTARLTCKPEIGVGLAVDPAGWQSAGEPASGGQTVHLEASDLPGELPVFRATAEPVVALPTLVVSRAYLRTARGSDETRTTALFRMESHGPSVEIALPEGGRWIDARIDGQRVAEVERVAADRYRLPMAPGQAGRPRVLAIEWACPSRGAGAWVPATLVGAVPGEAYWMVVVPGSQAVVGTPAGWSDENGWRWMGYVWMRDPLRGEDELYDWVAGPGGGPGSANDRASSRTNQHAYLFSRPDGPAEMPAMVMPRSFLLVACSGVIAGVGLVLVQMNPARRPIAAVAAVLCLLLAGSFAPDLTLQALLSGSLGFALTLVAAALQWVVNRRKSAKPGRFASVAGSSAPSSIGPVEVAAGPDPDESTAIRPRPASGSEAFVLASPRPEASSALPDLGARP